MGGSITNYVPNQGIGTLKKFDGWNEVIEKANKDFHENRKEFWAFFGKTSKGSRKGIACLRSTSGSCVTSIRESWKYYVSIMKGWVQHYWMISLMIAGKSI